MLFGHIVIAGFSIGLFYLPAVLAMVVAACVVPLGHEPSSRRRWRSARATGLSALSRAASAGSNPLGTCPVAVINKIPPTWRAQLALLDAPQAINTAAAFERLRIAREVGRDLHGLFEEVSELFLARISQPRNQSSYGTACVAAAKAAAWSKLGPALRDLGKAMVNIGRPRADYSRWSF